MAKLMEFRIATKEELDKMSNSSITARINRIQIFRNSAIKQGYDGIRCVLLNKRYQNSISFYCDEVVIRKQIGQNEYFDDVIKSRFGVKKRISKWHQ